MFISHENVFYRNLSVRQVHVNILCKQLLFKMSPKWFKFELIAIYNIVINNIQVALFIANSISSTKR